MAFWDWVAKDLLSFEAIMEAVTPLSIRVGGVQMSREEVIARAWADPSSGEALAVRTYFEGSLLDLSIGQSDQMNGAMQDQAERVWRETGRSTGGYFGVRVETTDMTQIIIPDTYRVAIEAQSGGQAVTNVVGVRQSNVTALQVAQAVQTAWKVASGPLANLSNTYALLGFRALSLNDVNGDIAFVADNTLGGVTTGSKSTNAASALVKWNGGTRSRSSRGRMYYGPIQEGQIAIDGRTLETTARTTINTAFTNFRNSLTNAGFQHVVISPTLMQAFPVTSHAVESVIATQRRRIRS